MNCKERLFPDACASTVRCFLTSFNGHVNKNKRGEKWPWTITENYRIDFELLNLNQLQNRTHSFGYKPNGSCK